MAHDEESGASQAGIAPAVIGAPCDLPDQLADQLADGDFSEQDELVELVAPKASEPSEATATVAAATGDNSTTSPWRSALVSLKLPLFVLSWYFFNVQYNIQNKKLLKILPATWAISFFQIFAGIPISVAMWTFGALRLPSVSRGDILKLTPVAVAFSAGQVATVASLSSVAVSFTHVVKALEPAVNAAASAMCLGQVFPVVVYASLLPIFAGVALASVSEMSFTVWGFSTAMVSNVAFASRNVLATKFGSIGDMGEGKVERKSNQLAVLTIMATLVTLPLAIALPGGLLSLPGAWESALSQGATATEVVHLMVSSGFHFFMYQLSSFWVLSQVRPITHSVLNTMKRVVVIVSSLFVFRNPISLQTALGTALAIAGILLYSKVKSTFAPKS